MPARPRSAQGPILGLALPLTVAALLSACGAPQARPGPAAPTVAPLFEEAAPAPTAAGGPRPTPALAAPPPPAETSAAGAAPAATIRELGILDEGLAPGWSLEHSYLVRADPAASDFARFGQSALAVLPEGDYGALHLTVAPGGPAYPEVLGVTFYLSGGEAELPPDALALSLRGSNRLTHYDPADRSAAGPGEQLPIYGEARLYDLELNRPIAPGEWVELTLWLDRMPYDPLYRNLTGIVIKNDPSYREPYYIDRLRLLVAGEE